MLSIQIFYVCSGIFVLCRLNDVEEMLNMQVLYIIQTVRMTWVSLVLENSLSAQYLALTYFGSLSVNLTR